MATQKKDYWVEQADIQIDAIIAWIARAEGRNDDALKLMREAADREDKTEKHIMMPGRVIPGARDARRAAAGAQAACAQRWPRSSSRSRRIPIASATSTARRGRPSWRATAKGADLLHATAGAGRCRRRRSPGSPAREAVFGAGREKQGKLSNATFRTDAAPLSYPCFSLPAPASLRSSSSSERPMISCMISLLPARMRLMRAPVYMREIGYSSM